MMIYQLRVGLQQFMLCVIEYMLCSWGQWMIRWTILGIWLCVAMRVNAMCKKLECQGTTRFLFISCLLIFVLNAPFFVL